MPHAPPPSPPPPSPSGWRGALERLRAHAEPYELATPSEALGAPMARSERCAPPADELRGAAHARAAQRFAQQGNVAQARSALRGSQQRLGQLCALCATL
jgi:hypothetical protein